MSLRPIDKTWSNRGVLDLFDQYHGISGTIPARTTFDINQAPRFGRNDLVVSVTVIHAAFIDFGLRPRSQRQNPDTVMTLCP